MLKHAFENHQGVKLNVLDKFYSLKARIVPQKSVSGDRRRRTGPKICPAAAQPFPTIGSPHLKPVGIVSQQRLISNRKPEEDMR